MRSHPTGVQTELTTRIGLFLFSTRTFVLHTENLYDTCVVYLCDALANVNRENEEKGVVVGPIINRFLLFRCLGSLCLTDSLHKA